MRLDLLRSPLVRSLLTNRWPQFLIQLLMLCGFLVAILAGLVGTPVGSRNLSIVFIWILWWAGLILIAVPLLGRGWCSICPIPLPGEWIQRGAVLGPTGGGAGRMARFSRRWPRSLRNIWLPNLAFSLLALFSAVILTQPAVTGVVLMALLMVATGLSLVFERRAFCRYLCPVGGFIGLYAQMTPLELRVRETSVCAGHRLKSCYTGDHQGYGCPWGVFPGGLVKNTNCGLCMECLRSCPHDNIGLYLRPAGADLSQKRDRGLDEAFKAFIMLGSALFYSAVMLGPWGGLKTAAYHVGSLPWLGYTLAFLATIYLLLPGGFLLSALAGRSLAAARAPLRKTFTAYAYALVPLGFGAWIAFSLSFVFANLSYIWPVLSDPLGWGWDLFGTAAMGWRPYAMALVPGLQSLSLLVGLAWSSRTACRIAAEDSPPGSVTRQAWPVIFYCGLITLGLIWLLVA